MRRLFMGIVCLASLFTMLLSMQSCKPSLPSDVLSKGKMADILYDYHLALAMAHTADGGDKGQSIAYREAVLKKHEVTSAEFDSSMTYYMRHTELMQDVYKDLADRLGKETVALGGSGSGSNNFDNLSATGDTANIWNFTRAMVLSPQKPFNMYSFKIEADTAFHKGDTFMLDFDSQFIYQDGIRDGIALLSVVFANDSVSQATVHISSTMHYTTQIADNANLGIKCVKGYFLLTDGGFASGDVSQTTLKLLFLNNIKLIRMHSQLKEAPKSPAPADSTKVDSGTVKPALSKEPQTMTPPMNVSSGKPMPVSKVKPLKPVRMLNDKELKPVEMKTR